MEGFFQASGAVLIAIVLSLTVQQQNKAISSVLTMAVCVMVLLLCGSYLQPMVQFLKELDSMGNLSGEMVSILLKTTLIGILSEIAALLCADSGNASLAQSLRILGSGVILWLSIPVFRGLMELVHKILEGI